jgi:hypothetical protein
MNNGDLVHFEAEYVFLNNDHYDVIVNRFGSYPYAETEIARFAEKLNAGPEPVSQSPCQNPELCKEFCYGKCLEKNEK